MKYTKLKKYTTMLLILLTCWTSELNAGYVDVGATNEIFTISTKHYASQFVLSAESSNVDKIGLGLGYKNKEIEFHNGFLFYDGGYDIYSSYNYKNGRHSIYNADLIYNKEKPHLKLGFTYMITGSWGLKIEPTLGKSQIFIGTRKWF